MELRSLKRALFAPTCRSRAILIGAAACLLLVAGPGCKERPVPAKVDAELSSTSVPAGHYQGPDEPIYSDAAIEDAERAAAEAKAAADAAFAAPSAEAPYPYSGRAYSTPCTDDCSGHDAGYAWAEHHVISSPEDCGGNSQSFIDGCEDYAREQQAYQIENHDCEDLDEDGLCD